MNRCELLLKDLESTQAVQHTVYLFDGFQLDVTRRKLISSGGLVQPLNSRAMEALLLLVANAGELVEKRRLMQTVWPDSIVEDNNLNQCVLAIRKALGETAGSNRYVMTVPGRGYRFVSPVHAVVQESSVDAVATPPRGRSAWTQWVGMSSAVGALLLAFPLLHLAPEPIPSPAVAEKFDIPDQESQAMVLRLRDQAGANSNAAAVSITELAHCLAARPDMKLLVQVRLVAQSGAPLWIGQYVAGAQDLLAPQPGRDAAATDCRNLTATVQPAQYRADRPAR